VLLGGLVRTAFAVAVTFLIAAPARADSDDGTGFFAHWAQTASVARATQPAWSSPIVTTTGMLEQRFRFDVARQQRPWA
jgi:hypothetical protein